MPRKTYGKTANGTPITEQSVADRAAEAEAGYDVEKTLRRRRGRPAMGSAAASVESVRLEPELQKALDDRAARDQTTASSVIREALREYLARA